MKVLVQSFSFKRTGYPKDETGKGGGFVFDCRAIDAFDYSLRDNPSAPYPHMHLTGLDWQVASTLNKDRETQDFLSAAWFMVKLDVEKCLKRKYSSMTVNFGCTAGQHRSVYMAEKIAQYIRTDYPRVDVELIHLERAYWPNNI